jgi:hypothetical protein
MPQLDKLIFFSENVGFILSFFGLVFYNQYYFYPQLLKNLFIRKKLISKNSINSLFNLFNRIQNFSLIMNFMVNSILQQISITNFNKNFKKLKLWLSIKFIHYYKITNLFLNKFLWIFISFFFEMYRSYIVEKDYKHEFCIEDFLRDVHYIK